MEAKERNDLTSRKRKQASADALDEDWWLQSNPNDDDAANGQDNLPQTNAKKIVDDDDSKIIKIPTETNAKKPKKRKNKHRNDSTTEDAGIEEKFSGALIKAAHLTPIEAEDYKLSGSNFLEEPKSLSGNADLLSSYLKTVIPRWRNEVKKYKGKGGSPMLLIITSSAIRAININKTSSEFKARCRAITLFAKHYKVHQHIQMLKKKIHFAVATPNRICKLVSEGALHFDRLKYVILDWNYRDAKERRLLDIDEIMEDVAQLLLKYFIPLAKQGKVKIGLF